MLSSFSLSTCTELTVFKERSSFCGEGEWEGLRTDGQGGREGKAHGGGEAGGTVATLKAAASQPRGEEPEGFGSSSFLLMSPFSCCNSESV